MCKNLHIARDEIRIIDAREIRGDGGWKNWSLFIGFFEGIFFLFELLSVSGVWTLERQSRVICEVAWSLIFLIDHRCQVVVRVGVVHWWNCVMYACNLSSRR